MKHAAVSQPITMVLLPGLHGTQDLFLPFIGCVGNTCYVRVIEYPTQVKRSYDELADDVVDQLDAIDSPYFIIAESFAGPLSIIVGKRLRKKPLAMVFVASFIRPPQPPWMNVLPWRLIFSGVKKLPSCLCRYLGLYGEIALQLRRVSSQVLANRLDQIFSTDVTAAFKKTNTPILYLQGTKDTIVLANSAETMASVQQKLMIKQCVSDHFVLQRQPQHSWLMVEAFLYEVMGISYSSTSGA